MPTKGPDIVAQLRPEPSGRADDRRIAELSAELEALREREARARLILDNARGYAIVTFDTEGRVTSWNADAQGILGYAEAEILGQSGEVLFTPEDRAAGRFQAELRRAAETGHATNERWHVRRDGGRFWASGLMMPLRDGAGRPCGFLNIMRDQTEAHTEAERRELLMAEMNHRIKNAFALVQALATQTGRHTESFPEFKAAFAARLKVLARSNDLLVRTGSQDAPLRDVIDSALEAYRDEAGRITMDGSPVSLTAFLVVTANLLLYELVTNAVKHGALSVPEGRVEVSWTVSRAGQPDSQVDILWRERGGPRVEPPRRRGFGTQVLERGVPPGGTVQLDFQPEGLECRIGLPLDDTAGQRESPSPPEAAAA